MMKAINPLLIGLGLSSVIIAAGCQPLSNSKSVTSKSATMSEASEQIHSAAPIQLRVATFNVSMEATNYQQQGEEINADALTEALSSGSHPQIKNIAEIIQRVRPDILLLNEFDYIADTSKGLALFQQKYLGVSQQGQQPLDYPYWYLAPVNTGVETPFQAKNSRLTHYGFGRYPGQYGMVVLSRYPINTPEIRTFQQFLWKDMPAHLMPVDENGESWYRDNEVEGMRLSSKSHWDIPVNVCGQTVRVLASHPTPPVFDGPEDRNGRRNHDEIRFWRDYIHADRNSYHYDDNGVSGGMQDHAPFVILGDLNANDVEGDAYPGAMSQLLKHPAINDVTAPTSDGGRANKPESPYAASHTAAWGMRADYVLSSTHFTVTDSGVFWPAPTDETARLVADRFASSDHRLVWANLSLPASGSVDTCEH